MPCHAVPERLLCRTGTAMRTTGQEASAAVAVGLSIPSRGMSGKARPRPSRAAGASFSGNGVDRAERHRGRGTSGARRQGGSATARCGEPARRTGGCRRADGCDPRGRVYPCQAHRGSGTPTTPHGHAALHRPHGGVGMARRRRGGRLPTARPGRGVGHRGRGQDGARPPGARRVAEAFPGGQLYVDLRGYGPEQPVPALEMDRRASGGTAIDLGMPRIAAAQPAQAEGTASLPQSLDDQQCH